MKRLLALLMLAFIVVSCATVAPNNAVRAFGAQPLVPEGWYEDAFEAMRECAEVSRPYADVEWYVVDAGMLGDFAGL